MKAWKHFRGAKELDDENGNPKKTRTGDIHRGVLERIEAKNDEQLREYAKATEPATLSREYESLRSCTKNNQQNAAKEREVEKYRTALQRLKVAMECLPHRQIYMDGLAAVVASTDTEVLREDLRTMDTKTYQKKRHSLKVFLGKGKDESDNEARQAIVEKFMTCAESRRPEKPPPRPKPAARRNPPPRPLPCSMAKYQVFLELSAARNPEIGDEGM